MPPAKDDLKICESYREGFGEERCRDEREEEREREAE